jgi:hypothetical protein
MAFVPSYNHDVFVSYAHIDDEPLVGAQRGWVTTLVNNLETVVRQKLGSKDLALWMDHELAGNQPLTPAIMSALGNTAILLIILSPGYVGSEWCRRERQTFLNLVQGKREAGSQVFVVYGDKLERSSVPAELADLIGYPFWIQEQEGKAPRTLGRPVPTPAETEYYSRVNQLGHELSQELKRLRAARDAGVICAPQGWAAGGLPPADMAAVCPPEGPTVFLAEVTDDLETRREEVRRYLSQAGLNVLPQTYYPRDDAGAFAQAMKADLARCKVFVQLLGAFAGRKVPALPKGYPELQHELAQAAGIRLLQWRSRNLDVGSVEDPAQRALLEGETVLACGIEEFKQAIVEEARRPSRADPEHSRDVLVFVNNDAPDRELAENVAKLLLAEGVGSLMPLAAGSPDEIRTDLEQNLLTCDGLLLIYGATTASWVRSQLRQSRKIISQREQPLAAMAVFEGPPPDKAGLDLMLPNLLQLPCRGGVNPAPVR